MGRIKVGNLHKIAVVFAKLSNPWRFSHPVLIATISTFKTCKEWGGRLAECT